MKALRSNDHGFALLELALICPLLFILFFGAIESSRGIGAINEGSTFAQETAVALSHECKDKHLSDSTGYWTASATACMTKELNDLAIVFRAKHPASAVIATLYRKGPIGIEVFAGPIRACVSSDEFDCDTLSTRIPLSRAKPELKQLVALSGWAVVVETFLKTDGVIETVLNPMKLENQVYYSATVL